MVQEVMFKLERAIEGVRRRDRKAAERWLAKQAPPPNGFNQASNASRRLKVERLKAALAKAEEELMADEQAPKRDWTRSSGGHTRVPGVNQIAHRIVEEVIEKTEQPEVVERDVLRRTPEGWTEPSSPSRYFRNRRKR